MKGRVKRNFSTCAENYDRLAKFQAEAGKRALQLLKRFGFEKPVVDLGAGTGRLLNGSGVFCLDLSPKMAKLCKERGCASVCGDAERLPFKDGSFSSAFSNFSLQWTDLQLSLKECSRTLKEGGLFVLSVPVEGSLKTLFKCWREVSDFPLFRFPTAEEVLKAFKLYFKPFYGERFTLKERFRGAKEALKQVNGIGAKNPHGRPKRKDVLKFLELYQKEPVVEYEVLIVCGRKRGEDSP